MDKRKKCTKCGEVKPLAEYPRHSAVKSGRGAQCKTCKQAYAQSRRDADYAAYQQYQRDYYQKNREHKLKLRSVERFKKYGITPEEFYALLEQQGYCCAICRESFDAADPRNVHIDHCHDNGHIRGILCRKCNLGIGYFQNNPDYLRRAAHYLSQ